MRCAAKHANASALPLARGNSPRSSAAWHRAGRRSRQPGHALPSMLDADAELSPQRRQKTRPGPCAR
eukprot:9473655-Pyramimonas_sp.AAC.1